MDFTAEQKETLVKTLNDYQKANQALENQKKIVEDKLMKVRSALGVSTGDGAKIVELAIMELGKHHLKELS